MRISLHLSAIAAVLSLTSLNATAQEQISAGCTFIDGLPVMHITSLSSLPRQFFAGETIEVSSSEPHDNGTPTQTILTVNSIDVDTDGFPGTVSYQFPQDQNVSFGWRVDAGNVDFLVSCTPEAVPLTPALTLDKTADVATYSAINDVINYTFLVTSSGTGPVAGPISIADDKETVTCPAVSTVGNNDGNLDPAEELSCTASHTVVQADITATSITNTATANGDAGETASNQDVVTVTYEAPPPAPTPLKPVPAVGQWAVILLTLLLALPGFAWIRARQQNNR